jgi:uncharacterized protein YqeY
LGTTNFSEQNRDAHGRRDIERIGAAGAPCTGRRTEGRSARAQRARPREGASRSLSDERSAGAPARAQAAVEAAEAFRTAGREEQAEDEEYELEVLEEFMPEPLSEEELEEIIDDVISEVGATNIRDIGRVMAGVMHQVSGRADGSTVNQLVKEKLA